MKQQSKRDATARPRGEPIVIPNTPASHRVIDSAINICNKYKATQAAAMVTRGGQK